MSAVKTSRRPSTRAAWKREGAPDDRESALLDAAAAEFNAYGLGGASLARIARAMDVKRAALYYYVDSREDLALRCYRRACETMASDLDAAAARYGTGLQRLLGWLDRALDPARAPAVVLSEIAWLEGGARAQIERGHRRNLEQLQSFLEQGMADGSMRTCDAYVVSRAIFGMVSWVPLAGEWVLGSGPAVRANAAAALRDVVTHGIAADRRASFGCDLDVAAFAFRPGNAFDRRAAADQKVELLLQTASRLFNRAGIDGVSLDDITAALGATKGAFYHHLPEKKALVVRCAQRAFDLYDRFADAAQQHGRSGLERAMIGLHLNAQAQADALSPLSPLTGLESLPPKILAQVRRRSSAVEERFEQFGHQGIADKSLRSYDVRTLALAGAGAFGWIPKWITGANDPGPRAIADEICALFLRGLRRR